MVKRTPPAKLNIPAYMAGASHIEILCAPDGSHPSTHVAYRDGDRMEVPLGTAEAAFLASFIRRIVERLSTPLPDPASRSAHEVEPGPKSKNLN